MLKIHQGHYVGYDALEKDISITKLPPTLTNHNAVNNSSTPMSSAPHWSDALPCERQVREDTVDISNLKEMPNSLESNKLNGASRSPISKVRPKHSFHNSYTIYEETSDLSGAESGVVDDASDAVSLSSNGKLSDVSQ